MSAPPGPPRPWFHSLAPHSGQFRLQERPAEGNRTANWQNVKAQIWGKVPRYFHRIGPLGRFGLLVAMSMCVGPYICLEFLSRPLIGLRSHNQISASHWSIRTRGLPRWWEILRNTRLPAFVVKNPPRRLSLILSPLNWNTMGMTFYCKNIIPLFHMLKQLLAFKKNYKTNFE